MNLKFEGIVNPSKLLSVEVDAILEQLTKSNQDKTFKKRLLSILDGKPIKIGKGRRLFIDLFCLRWKNDGVICEDFNPSNIPPIVDDDQVEIVFETQWLVATEFMIPVTQFSIQIHRSALK